MLPLSGKCGGADADVCFRDERPHTPDYSRSHWSCVKSRQLASSTFTKSNMHHANMKKLLSLSRGVASKHQARLNMSRAVAQAWGLVGNNGSHGRSQPLGSCARKNPTRKLLVSACSGPRGYIIQLLTAKHNPSLLLAAKPRGPQPFRCLYFASSTMSHVCFADVSRTSSALLKASLP